MKRILIRLIKIYQQSIGYYLGGHCRFSPTCSHYAQDAISAHGSLKGVILTLKRLAKCHPLGGYGYDPVNGGEK